MNQKEVVNNCFDSLVTNGKLERVKLKVFNILLLLSVIFAVPCQAEEQVHTAIPNINDYQNLEPVNVNKQLVIRFRNGHEQLFRLDRIRSIRFLDASDPLAGSSWKVGDKPGVYHSQPWDFVDTTKVEAVGYWHGVWVETGDLDYSITIVHNNGITNTFSIRLAPDGKSFKGYKDGQLFRYGVRISSPVNMERALKIVLLDGHSARFEMRDIEPEIEFVEIEPPVTVKKETSKIAASKSDAKAVSQNEQALKKTMSIIIPQDSYSFVMNSGGLDKGDIACVTDHFLQTFKDVMVTGEAMYDFEGAGRGQLPTIESRYGPLDLKGFELLFPSSCDHQNQFASVQHGGEELVKDYSESLYKLALEGAIREGTKEFSESWSEERINQEQQAWIHRFDDTSGSMNVGLFTLEETTIADIEVNFTKNDPTTHQPSQIGLVRMLVKIEEDRFDVLQTDSYYSVWLVMGEFQHMKPLSTDRLKSVVLFGDDIYLLDRGWGYESYSFIAMKLEDKTLKSVAVFSDGV